MPLLLVSVVAFLARPALGLNPPGQVDPVAPGVRASEIVDGTVSSVISSGGGGQGPVFTMLGGALLIDASAAQVTSGDTAGAPATVTAGSHVVVLLAAPASEGATSQATSVLVLTDLGSTTIHGSVQSIDTTADSFVVGGITIFVTSSTVFGGHGLTGLADLRVNDNVVAVVTTSAGKTTAERVMRLGVVPSPMEHVEGTVVSIGTTSWVLHVDGKDMTINVDAQTKVVGDPKMGDTVEALGRTNSSGVFTASLIVKRPPPPPPVVNLRGSVVSESDTSWVIDVNGTNTTVAVDAHTHIVGAPKVGDTVEVVAERQTDGSLFARQIVKVGGPPSPPAVVTFRGTVVSESATSWVVSDGGTDRTVAVDAHTHIVGAPKVGDMVEVVAERQTDGSLLAKVIARVGAPAPPAPVTFQGTVNAMHGMTWTVGTTRVMVLPTTVVTGSPKVGDTVKVEGMQLPNGNVLASKVTKV